MNTIEAITTAIAQLPPEQVAQIRAWLTEYEERQWDEQIAQDERNGRLDALAQRALAETWRGADAAPLTPHTTSDFWDCYTKLLLDPR